MKLYLAKSQRPGKLVEGTKLRKELEGQPILNACVLDYLLAHPELIPEEWKGKTVLFWGTIYHDLHDNLVVRYLYWEDNGWCWKIRWLGGCFSGSNPAAVLAA